MEANAEIGSAPANLGQDLSDAFASKLSISDNDVTATLASASAGALREEDIIPRKEDTPALGMSDSGTGIFQRVSKFMSSVQPYQFILPPDLRKEMNDLKGKIDKRYPKDTSS